MKIITICVFILLIFTNCFAEWRDSKYCWDEWRASNYPTKCLEDMSGEEIGEYFDDIDSEFRIPEVRSKKGFVIVASSNTSYKTHNSMVCLRYLNNKVDFQFDLFKNLWKGNGTIYLELLDEDGFLIVSKLVSKIADGYTGTLLGNFSMKWETFKEIKYYSLVMKR